MAADPARPLLRLTIDGIPHDVAAGTTVAVAVWHSGLRLFRRSVHQQPRAPLCGMGICFECRLTIDGVAHRRSCQLPCAAGMDVRTDG